MRLHVLIALGISSALVLGTTALAQQPAPSAPPAASPGPAPVPPPDYGPPITNEQAKGVAAAAFAEAKKNNWRMAFAIVGPAGELVYFEKMDGTQLASVEISQGKARTAARYRRPSQIFYNAYETGHPYVSTLDPTLVASPGGFPLVEGGKLIGAIGCSGGTGDQDALICKVGADMIK